MSIPREVAVAASPPSDVCIVANISATTAERAAGGQSECARQATAAHDALALISAKWTIDVLLAVRERPLRFGMLERRLDHIARKVLTQTLRGMQRDGLLWRRSSGVVGKPVEYGLTPLGASLLDRVSALARWSDHHISAVESSRARFDRSE